MSLVLLYHAESVGPVCQRLSRAATELGLDGFQVVRDNQQIPNADVLVRWGSRVPAYGASGRVINSAEAVSLARDKRTSRQRLGSLAPQTWFFRDHIKLPCVIRPKAHHGGLKFFVCRTPLEVRDAIRRCGLKWYATELVDKKEEYRVFVLQGRVVCVSQRFPASPNAIAWNLEQGGKLTNVKFGSWPMPAVKAAIEATQKIGLNWAAVDVAIDTKDRVVIFELNTAPGLRNPYTLGQLAKAFSWIEDHGAPEELKGADKWKQVIHPGLV